MAEIKYLNPTGAQSIINETKTRLDTKQNIMQKTTLPDASATELNNVYQYVGVSGSGLINGYFYKCIENSTSGLYEWTAINVQSSNVSVSGETLIFS